MRMLNAARGLLDPAPPPEPVLHVSFADQRPVAAHAEAGAGGRVRPGHLRSPSAVVFGSTRGLFGCVLLLCDRLCVQSNARCPWLFADLSRVALLKTTLAADTRFETKTPSQSLNRLIVCTYSSLFTQLF